MNHYEKTSSTRANTFHQPKSRPRRSAGYLWLFVVSLIAMSVFGFVFGVHLDLAFSSFFTCLIRAVGRATPSSARCGGVTTTKSLFFSTHSKEMTLSLALIDIERNQNGFYPIFCCCVSTSYIFHPDLFFPGIIYTARFLRQNCDA